MWRAFRFAAARSVLPGCFQRLTRGVATGWPRKNGSRSEAIARNKRILERKHVKEHLKMYEKEHWEMNDVNLTTLFVQLGKQAKQFSQSQLHRHPTFLNMCNDAANMIAGGCQVRAGPNIAHALAKLGADSEAVFTAVAGQAARLAADGNPQNLSNTVWAFATVGRSDAAVFAAVAGQAARLAADGYPQALSNTVWAFGIAGRLDCLHPRSLAHLWGSIANTPPNEFSTENLQQLQQGLISLQFDPTLQTSVLPKPLMDAILQADQQKSVTVSQSQRVMSNLLQDLWPHQLELVVPVLISQVPLCSLSLDAGCVSSKTGIEFHGPSHYIVCGTTECLERCTGVTACLDKKDLMLDVKGVPNGATRFKARVWRALGWRVQEIHYKDWNSVYKARAKEQSAEFWELLTSNVRALNRDIDVHESN